MSMLSDRELQASWHAIRENPAARIARLMEKDQGFFFDLIVALYARGFIGPEEWRLLNQHVAGLPLVSRILGHPSTAEMFRADIRRALNSCDRTVQIR